MRITQPKANESHFEGFKYMVFDGPQLQGNFEERYLQLQRILSPNRSKSNSNQGAYCELAPLIECRGRDHLEEVFQDIVRNKGEGVMLRKPQSPYVAGRTDALLKKKVVLIAPSFSLFWISTERVNSFVLLLFSYYYSNAAIQRCRGKSNKGSWSEMGMRAVSILHPIQYYYLSH